MGADSGGGAWRTLTSGSTPGEVKPERRPGVRVLGGGRREGRSGGCIPKGAGPRGVSPQPRGEPKDTGLP